MNICIFGNYVIEYENKYCYINEDGDHSDGIASQRMTLDGGELIKKIVEYINDPLFLEMNIKENQIYFSLFDPFDGTGDNITLTIKLVEAKRI